MKKNTMTNAMIFILIGIILLTVVVAVLSGENGIIKQEMDKYNQTHIEENQEKQGENIIVVNNK